MRNHRQVVLVGVVILLALLSLGQQNIVPRINLAHARLNALLTSPQDTSAPVDLRAGTTIGGAAIGTGGGEANTGGNLGGGLASYDSKSGVQLRFNSRPGLRPPAFALQGRERPSTRDRSS